MISKQRTLFTQFKERLSKNLFLILCLWWFAGNLLFYSLAGEKMPWLLAHISLPLSFIAAIGWSFWLRRPLCSLGFWLAIISLLILAPLSIANCLRATFWHGDLATEPLVYAHGSPDHKIIRAIIAAAAKEGGNTPVVAYGPDCTWPLAWYLRHTPHIFNASSNVQAQCPVIFTGADRFHQKQDYFGPDYTCERLVLILWPIEWWKDGYFLRRVFHDPSAAKKLWELAVTRQCDAKLMHNWPLRTDVLVFLKKGGDFQNDNAIATPR